MVFAEKGMVLGICDPTSPRRTSSYMPQLKCLGHPLDWKAGAGKISPAADQPRARKSSLGSALSDPIAILG